MSEAFPYFPDDGILGDGEEAQHPSTAAEEMRDNSENESDAKDLYRYYCFSPIRRNGKIKRGQRTGFSSPVDPSKRSRALLESSNHVQHVNAPHPQMNGAPHMDHPGPSKAFSFPPMMDHPGRHHMPEYQKPPYMHERPMGMYPNAMDLSLAPPFGVHRIKTMNSHSSAWNERFQELLKYKAEFGDCLVPQRYPKNPQLGVWVNKQRAEYKLLKEGKKSSMTDERIRTLESVGFVWAKRRKGQPTWDLKFEELTTYKQKHGDCLVPTKYAENPALGRWVSTQRAQYKLMKEGKASTMTEERVKTLERIGFVWRLQF